jgi:competence protein ComEA
MLGSMQPPGALAWPVADGGTGPADAATAAEAAELPRAPGVLPDGRVVLNTATEQELTKLPKVGPKRAAAIVALRQRMGRLRSVRDLLRVKGVGVRTLQRITPLVVLDPPVQAASDGGK